MQGFDDCVHEAHGLIHAIGIRKFVMKSIRKSRAKFKAVDKGRGAFVARNRIVLLEQGRDGGQSISLEAIELLRYLEAAKQCPACAIRSSESSAGENVSHHASSLAPSCTIASSISMAVSGRSVRLFHDM